MTDVSNLDNLAAAISSGSPKIKDYAKAQAAATQSQEVDIQAALAQPGIPGPAGPQGVPGPQGPPGSSGGGLVHPAIRYVQDIGSDSNDGSSWAAPKKSIQAGYDALPSNGGTVIIAPTATAGGGYDVGAGVQCQNSKPCVFQSAMGPRQQRAPISVYKGENASWVPRIYTTSTTATELFKCTGGNAQGFGWVGLAFDISQTGLRQALLCENVSYALLDDCAATGPQVYVQDRYLVRAYVTASGDDASWWNMTDNAVRRAGLCNMGLPAGGNNNRHYIAGNRLLGDSGMKGTAMKFEFPASVTTFGNNIEGYEYGIWMHAAVACHFYGDGGEQISRLIFATSAYGCLFSPAGQTNVSGQKLVTVQGGDNVILAAPLAGGSEYPADPSRTGPVDGGPNKYTMVWPNGFFDSP
jgi:hypothetical protein